MTRFPGKDIVAQCTVALLIADTMLAARIDQENAIHARQQAAAAKPLNQGAKGLAPKTPGNRAPKTPGKIPLNDENEADKFGGKGKQQGGKAEKNLFQTPART